MLLALKKETVLRTSTVYQLGIGGSKVRKKRNSGYCKAKAASALAGRGKAETANSSRVRR